MKSDEALKMVSCVKVMLKIEVKIKPQKTSNSMLNVVTTVF